MTVGGRPCAPIYACRRLSTIFTIQILTAVPFRRASSPATGDDGSQNAVAVLGVSVDTDAEDFSGSEAQVALVIAGEAEVRADGLFFD